MFLSDSHGIRFVNAKRGWEHNGVAHKVTTAPTATEKGVKTYTFSRCDATRTEEIPAAGKWENPFTDAPDGNVTREQVAAILMRYVNNIAYAK